MQEDRGPAEGLRGPCSKGAKMKRVRVQPVIIL